MENEKKKAKVKRRQSSRWIQFSILGLFSIVVLVGASYFIYIQKHAQQLEEYYLRVLSVSGDNIEERLRNVQNNVVNAVTGTAVDSLVKPTLELLPYITNIDSSLDRVPAAWETDWGTTAAPNHKLETVLGRWQDQRILSFSLLRNKGATESWFTASTNLAEIIAPLLEVARQDLRDFDTVLLARSEGEILLETSVSGSPLNLVDLSEIQLRNAGEEEVAAAEHFASHLTHTQIVDVVIADIPYKLFLQPIPLPIDIAWRNAIEPNRMPWNNYAARDSLQTYYEGSARSRQAYWTLGGLQKAATFRSQAMSISIQTLFGAIGILILALLALPYLKIRYIGIRESLKTHDILVLVVSFIMASSITTYAFLDILTYFKFRNYLDRTTEQLATEIEEAFSEEIAALNAQLHLLNRNQYDGSEIRTDLLQNQSEWFRTYPFIEMAYWIDESGIQQKKWSVKSRPTPLIDVSDRLYFIMANNGDLWGLGEDSSLVQDDSVYVGWYIESIRSKNTGEVSAVLSQRLASEPPEEQPVVAAALSPLLSVIKPVIPPGYGFSIINPEGAVLFHHDETRNLRENILDEVNERSRLRSAVRSESSTWFDMAYRDNRYRAYISPFEHTPWSLLVFAERSEPEMLRGEILGFGYFMYFIYLLPLILVFLTLQILRSQAQTPESSIFIWFWPTHENTYIYIRILYGTLTIIAAWIVSMIWLSSTESVLAAGIFPLIGFIFAHRLLHRKRNEDAGKKSKLLRTTTIAAALILLALIGLGGLWGLLILTLILIVVISLIGKTVRAADFQMKYWKTHYVFTVFLLIVLTGILPPITFYRAAYNESMVLHSKDHQITFAQRLRQRIDNRRQRFNNIKLADSSRAFIDSLLHPPAGDLGQTWDVHAHPYLIIETNSSLNAEFETMYADDSLIYAEPITNWLRQWLPGISSRGLEIRQLSDTSLDQDFKQVRWDEIESMVPPSAYAPPDSNVLFVYRRIPQYNRMSILGADAVPPTTATDFRNLLVFIPTQQFTFEHYYLWWLALLPAVAVLYWIIHSSIKLIYMINEQSPQFVRGKELPEAEVFKHRLILRGDVEELEEIMKRRNIDPKHVFTIDSSQITEESNLNDLLKRADNPLKKLIKIEDFHDGLWHPEIARKKLLLLESLLMREEKTLIVFSDINPLHFFTMQMADHFRGLTESSPDLGRWATALERLTRSRNKPTPSIHEEKDKNAYLHELCRASAGQPGRTEALSSGEKNDPGCAEIQKHPDYSGDQKTRLLKHLKLIAEECWSDDTLRETGIGLAAHPDLIHLENEDQVLRQLLDYTEAYYRKLWALSGKDEKMVLYRICQESFTSWRSSEIVRRLIHRGLVLRDPNFKPMNKSFRQFVLSAELPEVFAKWEREAGSSIWARLRTPLIILILLFAAFFFATQPGIFQRTIAFTTTIAAVVPALIKLLALTIDSRAPAGG